jgi:hypothetical protein
MLNGRLGHNARAIREKDLPVSFQASRLHRLAAFRHLDVRLGDSDLQSASSQFELDCWMAK